MKRIKYISRWFSINGSNIDLLVVYIGSSFLLLTKGLEWIYFIHLKKDLWRLKKFVCNCLMDHQLSTIGSVMVHPYWTTCDIKNEKSNTHWMILTDVVPSETVAITNCVHHRGPWGGSGSSDSERKRQRSTVLFVSCETVQNSSTVVITVATVENNVWRYYSYITVATVEKPCSEVLFIYHCSVL